MEPVLFRTLPDFINLVAVAILIQIGILLFATGRRYLKWVSVVAVSLVGALVGEGAAVSTIPSASGILIIMGLLGGAALGYFLRPVGVGLVLAYVGSTIATNLVNVPFVQYVVAMDLFAYGLLLTDLAPTLVSSLLGSSILLITILWTGVSAPSALVLASAFGAARVMASLLPRRFEARGHNPRLTKGI